jgi:hypothetical protein
VFARLTRQLEPRGHSISTPARSRGEAARARSVARRCRRRTIAGTAAGGVGDVSF